MESAALSTSLFNLSKNLKSSPNFSSCLLRCTSNQAFHSRLSSLSRVKCIQSGNIWSSKDRLAISFAAHILRSSPSAPSVVRNLACISSSVAAFGSGGGGDGSEGGAGGGGGDGGSNGGGVGKKSLPTETDEVSTSSLDVIVLDVGGMTCGGCAASVKRILESQPQVSSATVNLATETAVVWVKPEVQLAQDWKKQVGENLAKHLTNCGFKSNLRGEDYLIEGETQS